jgi:hypothetical protein
MATTMAKDWAKNIQSFAMNFDRDYLLAQQSAGQKMS